MRRPSPHHPRRHRPLRADSAQSPRLHRRPSAHHPWRHRSLCACPAWRVDAHAHLGRRRRPPRHHPRRNRARRPRHAGRRRRPCPHHSRRHRRSRRRNRPRDHPRRRTLSIAHHRTGRARRLGPRARSQRRPSAHRLPRHQPRRLRRHRGVVVHGNRVLDDVALLQHLPVLDELDLLGDLRHVHGWRRRRNGRRGRRHSGPSPHRRQHRRPGDLRGHHPHLSIVGEVDHRDGRRGRRQVVQRMRAPRHGRGPPHRARILGLGVRVVTAEVLPRRQPTEHAVRFRTHERGGWWRHAQGHRLRSHRHGRGHGLRPLRGRHLDEPRLALDAVALRLELEQAQLRRDVRNDAHPRDEPERIRVLELQRAGHGHLEPPSLLRQREGQVLLRLVRGQQLQHRVRSRREVRFLRHRVTAHLPEHPGQGVDVEDAQLDKVGAQPTAVDELRPEGLVELRLRDEALADQDRSKLFGHVPRILDAFPSAETPHPARNHRASSPGCPAARTAPKVPRSP